MQLPLQKLITFNDEFAAFFREPARVERIQHSNCKYDASAPKQSVHLEDSKRAGWLFLRNNGHTYLLIETTAERTSWNSWFAPDPKRILLTLRQELQVDSSLPEWESLFPLVRQAHRESHRDREESRNADYLQQLITGLYHADNLSQAFKRHIDELVSRFR